MEVVSELLRERLAPTSQYVESLIAIERAYINTNHPDFLGAAGAMANLENESRRKKKLEKRKVLKRSFLFVICFINWHWWYQPVRTSSPAPSVVSSTGSRTAAEEDTVVTNGVLLPPPPHKENGISPATNGDSGNKDSFLNYFFGGASKTDRPALGPQELMNSAPPPMSVTSMMETELERKFEQVSYAVKTTIRWLSQFITIHRLPLMGLQRSSYRRLIEKKWRYSWFVSSLRAIF